MGPLIDRIRQLRERPRLCALILGAMCALAFQPLALWPLGLLAMAGLIGLVSASRGWKEAALLGWLFGFSHFTLGNNWIATAFAYQAEMPAWLGWLAVPLLSIYLALYPALATGAARALAGGPVGSGTPMQQGWALVVLFSGCWTLSEWLRGWLFTGFAWNPFGIILLGGFDRPGLAALSPWLGTYALSGLAVLLAGVCAMLLTERAYVALGVVAGLVAAGMLAPAERGRDGQLAATLVQPDLRQENLDIPSQFEAQFRHIAGLSLPRRPGQRRLVLWPESGLPDYLQDGYPQRYYEQRTAFADPAIARKRLGRVIGPGSLLLTGAVDLELRGGRAAGVRNAITAVDGNGAIRGSYFKAHLVPYGEYLPMRWLLEPLGASRLVGGSFEFWPGPGPRTLDFGAWGKAGMQICYEITFSGEVTDRRARPDYIFNPSNDGWFGRWGPPQHLAQARLRALEEGLPVLRVTTTGISAIIDGHGIVRQHVPMHRAMRIDALVPPALKPTLFARLGNALPVLLGLMAIGIGLVARARVRR